MVISGLQLEIFVSEFLKYHSQFSRGFRISNFGNFGPSIKKFGNFYFRIFKISLRIFAKFQNFGNFGVSIGNFGNFRLRIFKISLRIFAEFQNYDSFRIFEISEFMNFSIFEIWKIPKFGNFGVSIGNFCFRIFKISLRIFAGFQNF